MSTPPIKANLLHLSYNMWADETDPLPVNRNPHIIAKPYLRLDQQLWDELLLQMAEAGLNMVVVDVGDGVLFESHPEISVKGAWSREKVKHELHKARDMGIELIPKLNFSASHDVWLKVYSRMLSTPVYYQVVRDLIEETISLFESPRLFHLGMDEETAGHQRMLSYAVLRQHDLWWHDLELMVQIVEDHGAQAWMWSDYCWNHPEAFVQRMSKRVLQSNWYYGCQFTNLAPDSKEERYVKAYDLLEQHGFDQVPTSSNWECNTNMQSTVDYCSKVISPSRLKGFLMSPWRITLPEHRQDHVAAIKQLQAALQ